MKKQYKITGKISVNMSGMDALKVAAAITNVKSLEAQKDILFGWINKAVNEMNVYRLNVYTGALNTFENNTYIPAVNDLIKCISECSEVDIETSKIIYNNHFAVYSSLIEFLI